MLHSSLSLLNEPSCIQVKPTVFCCCRSVSLCHGRCHTEITNFSPRFHKKVDGTIFLSSYNCVNKDAYRWNLHLRLKVTLDCDPYVCTGFSDFVQASWAERKIKQNTKCEPAQGKKNEVKARGGFTSQRAAWSRSLERLRGRECPPPCKFICIAWQGVFHTSDPFMCMRTLHAPDFVLGHVNFFFRSVLSFFALTWF